MTVRQVPDSGADSMPLSIDATAVPRATLEARRDKLVAAMQAAGMDLAVFTTAESIFYLTGIDVGGRIRPHALVLRDDGAHHYLTRQIEIHWRDNWAPQTWAKDWHVYGDESTLTAEIATVVKSLARKGAPRLGLELNRPSISYAEIREIEAATGAAALLSAAPLVERLRMRKDADEIANMRRAGEITRAGIEAAADIIRGGGTEAEAAGAAFMAMAVRFGCQTLAAGPFVASGPRTAMAHGNWEQVRPRPGEVVVIWMSGSFRRYQAPIERTYVKGAPDRELARMLDVSIEAAEHTMARVRPGMTAHEGDRICRDVIEKAGYGEYFLNRAAYGIGISYPPTWGENALVQMKPGDDLVLEAGMTLHLVPALHVKGVGFVHRSMPIVITERGCEPLTTMPLRVDPL